MSGEAKPSNPNVALLNQKTTEIYEALGRVAALYHDSGDQVESLTGILDLATVASLIDMHLVKYERGAPGETQRLVSNMQTTLVPNRPYCIIDTSNPMPILRKGAIPSPVFLQPRVHQSPQGKIVNVAIIYNEYSFDPHNIEATGNLSPGIFYAIADTRTGIGAIKPAHLLQEFFGDPSFVISQDTQAKYAAAIYDGQFQLVTDKTYMAELAAQTLELLVTEELPGYVETLETNVDAFRTMGMGSEAFKDSFDKLDKAQQQIIMKRIITFLTDKERYYRTSRDGHNSYTLNSRELHGIKNYQNIRRLFPDMTDLVRDLVGPYKRRMSGQPRSRRTFPMSYR